jgi:hypothetical protein
MRSGTQLRKSASPPSAVAEVRIRLYGSSAGESELMIEVAPGGAFGGIRGGAGGRAAAYAKLLEVASRELRQGLQRLGSF